MPISCYIQLNLLVLMFLLVIFLMNRIHSPIVYSGLGVFFSPVEKSNRGVSIRPLKLMKKKPIDSAPISPVRK